MQAGLEHTKLWVLEGVNRQKSIDPLMGWTSSDNTTQQLCIKFATKEEAIDFAKKNNISYEVRMPQKKVIKPNSYSDNFI